MSDKMKWSRFRNWVHNLWLENCEEHFEEHLPAYKSQEYWEKYKYWLKREYRHQLKNSDG